MWSKKDKNDPYSVSGEESFTFLGKGAQFKGIISFEGTIRIDGKLEGEIHTKGTLVVGEHAVIEGDVSADVIISGGRVTGNIIASEKVQLLATGVVIGTIKTPILSIEEGVRFSGTCDAEGRGEVRALEGAREPEKEKPPQQASVARVRGA
ncbi:MAG TPA: polymer-forming cytoskeletal protein [Nitrospirales bacterium]|jgi:cytoskeletal protein CcmA (bactofilin family)|nr:polymer-forming cytoskeletal protein [Nitrospirales bacterium]